jgi:hypothetical protein
MSSDVLLIEDSSGAVKRAKSEDEYIFHLALRAEQIQFLYEFGIFGGHRTLGGVSVDFMCWLPFATAVEITGAYWHRNSTRERFRTAIITSYFGREPIFIVESETEDIAAARSAIKAKLK